MAGQSGVGPEQPGQIGEERQPCQALIRLGVQSDPVLGCEVSQDERPLLKHGQDGYAFALAVAVALRVEVFRELVPLVETRELVFVAATISGCFGCSVA